MATVLKNIVRFAGLGVGVPASLPHGLNLDGRAIVPELVLPNTGPFTVVVDATDVTVTRTNDSPGAAVDVYVEWFYTPERVFDPQNDPPAGLPLVVGVGGVGGGGIGPASFWIGGRESYDQQTPQLVVGAIEFDKSRYSFSTIRFRAVGAKGDTVNAEVELFNVTDAASVATLTFTTTAQALQQSADIAASLPASSKIYECRINLAGAPGGNDSVELYKAELEVTP